MSKEMEDDVSMLVIKYESLDTGKSEETAPAQNEEIESEVVEETAASGETPAEEAPASLDSQMELPKDAVDGIESAQEEVQMEPQTSEETSPSASSEVPAEEEKKPADDMGLPEGFEMPDLSDLDAMMKEAGL